MKENHQQRKTPSLHSMMFKIILIPIVTVIIILFGVVLFGANIIREEIITRQELLIDALARQIDEYWARTGQLMQSLVYAMIDFSPEAQTKLLTQTRARCLRFSTLYLLDDTGRVVAEGTEAATLLGLDMSRERFFDQVKSSKQTYFSTPFISVATGQITVTAVVPVLQDKVFRGMLVGELNLEILQQAVEQLVKEEEERVFIVDHRGTIVAHPLHTWVQEQRNVGHLPLVKQGLAGETAFDVFYDETQQRWVVGSTTPIAWNWAVVMTQPLSVAIRPLLFLFLIAGIALGVSLVLFFWAQISSLHQISAPIANLAQKADALACHQYDEALMGSGGQFCEILSLEYSFSRMAKAVADRTAALMEANISLQKEIAERKFVEEQVRMLNAELEYRVQQRTAELEAANKELKEFAYIVSHDLKAPLRGIHRLTHWLVEEYNDVIDAQGKELMDLLIGRVKRMTNLIDGILRYSRIGQLNLKVHETIDLNVLLDEVLDLLNPPQHICIEIPSDLPTIPAERTRIFQVFQNLISNAIKFLDKPHGQIIVQYLDKGPYWTFHVTDNGPGIEKHQQERIFHIFQTLQPRDEVESTGIGLALVKKIVELYGGTIGVESEVGKGATFWFTFPKKEDIYGHAASSGESTLTTHTRTTIT
ncbi:hypothetical protein GF348_21950 [candidate division KSB3 bacterium]|nr:hypothetical protein [candidate division KSB3 bacterium]